MLRFIIAIMMTIFVVIFVMANTHQVSMSLVVGQVVRVRLIFLLMITFAFGVVSSIFLSMFRRIRIKARVQHELRVQSRGASPELLQD